MSLFGSFADVLAKFSPRRPHHHRRLSLSQHSNNPPSRPHSQSPTSRIPPQIEIETDQLALGLDEDDNSEEVRERSHGNATSELNIQSDENHLSSIGSGNLRSSISQLEIPLSVRSGHSPQMLSGEQKRFETDRHEEARLFGAKNINDNHATKIVPGALFQKKKKIPGSSAAFKPTDTLSQHARESGPVRAQGKSKQSKPHGGKLPQRVDDVSDDFEDPSRPRKRRRQEDPGSSNTRHDSTPDQLSRMSPGSSQYSSLKSRSNGLTSRHAEYRDVEENIRIASSPRRARHHRFSEESEDEKFTAQASHQRRSLIQDHGSTEPHKRVHPPFDTVPVVVPSGKDTFKQVLASPTQITGPRRTSSSRESPDELQGETTTKPIPRNLNDKPKQNRHKQQVRSALITSSRKRSPTDIQPTDFTGSPRQGPKRTRHNSKVSSGFQLEVTSIRFGPIVKKVPKDKSVVVHLHEDGLEVGEDIAGPRNRTLILLRNVVLVIRGREPSMKIRLKLAKKTDAPGNLVDIELSTTTSKNHLVKTLQDKEIKIQDKDESYMDKAFANHERELIEHGNSPTRHFLHFTEGELAPEANPAPQPAFQPSMRQKISSALQESASESAQIMRKTQDITENSNDMDTSHVQTKSEQIQESAIGIELPVKTCEGPMSAERETRARTRQTTRESERPRDPNEISPSRLHLRSPEKDTTREKWKMPLVYPQAGKKRAEVNEEDRDRLREGEFLNDNLIGFYMRFLQDHLERTNPKAAKQVYFFNSYFFATLTNTPKGERGINYGGVEKWTRSVDLFSYDYIVVPINQNAHWYVAIICNLPSLRPETTDQVESSLAVDLQEPWKEPEGEVFKILESPGFEPRPTTPARGGSIEASQKRASESPNSHEARQSLASMSLDGRKTLDNPEKHSGSAEEWPDYEENQASPPAKFSPVNSPETPDQPVASSQTARNSKKKTRAGQNVDPRQTKIVTFDSLGHSRSPTIRILKEYILKEAASKCGIDVELADIKGMCARQIPLQPNFSDCGLYLLAYLEKFAQNPDLFTRKLLRREMDEHADWPPLGSGLLRYRLRSFLDELYDEQIQLKATKDQPSIMADQQPVSFLLGPPLPSQDTEDPAQATPSLTEEGQSGEVPKTTRASKKLTGKESLPHETPEPSEEAADVPQLVPISLVDGSSNAKVSHEQKPTDADKPSGLIRTEVTEVPDSQELISDVAQASSSSLAERKRTKKAEDLTGTRKSERKKTTHSNDAEVVATTKSRPETSPKAPKVEIQIRETPPPNDELVRKSPRGKRKN